MTTVTCALGEAASDDNSGRRHERVNALNEDISTP
jgi:hypothetical protein